MLIYKVSRFFCAEKVLNQSISSKFQSLINQLDQNPTSTLLKSRYKTIFSLQQAIQAEQKYIMEFQKTKVMIDSYLKGNQYKYQQSKHCSWVQIQKSTQDYILSIMIMPKPKSEMKKGREKLPWHELDNFEKEFDYLRLQAPELKADEDHRREVIKDELLDQENPFDANIEQMFPSHIFISVQKDLEEELLFIKCEIADGTLQLSSVQFLNNFKLECPWEQTLLNICNQYEDQYKVDFMELPELLQKALLEFIQSFNFGGSDGKYLELIAINQQQQLYIQWLQRLQDTLYSSF